MPMNPQIQYGGVSITGGTYTAAPGDTVLVTTGASALVVNLPVQSGCFSPVIVRKVDAGTGTVTVKTTDGTTIDGVSGGTGVAATAAHTGFVLAPVGSNWNVVGA